MKHLLLTVALAALLSSSAQAWWNGDWSIRRKIVIDTTGISEAIGTTPVLIRLHDGDFQFAAAADDGSDLRFIAADDKTPLAYHIEKYDTLLGQAFVWVKVSDLKPGAQTVLWLYYGSTTKKATPGAADPKATYDGDTVLVYHFAERNAPARDATASGINAQNAGTPVSGSLIGSGIRFDGRNAVTIPAGAPLAWNGGEPLTWSAWVKPATLSPDAVLYRRGDESSHFIIGLNNGVPYVQVNGQRSPTGAPLAVNAWRHLAVVASGTKTTVYVDGAPFAALGAGLPALNDAATLGGGGLGGADAGGFSGELDELEISKVARPVGFLKLAALEQGGGDRTAKVLAMGQDEQAASWISPSYGVILKAVTVDGWFVIGILAIALVTSLIVIVSKAIYLQGITRGNTLFFAEWHHVSTDLETLRNGNGEGVLEGRVDKVKQQVMRRSPLYHIYRLGKKEIERRLTRGKSVLSSQSIHAIRAALDTGSVREREKLDQWLVVLAITAAGGPFIGLFGTVIGVMMTFADISLAGDVNVNAIAPGISGALVATAAGLMAAIPAMLGSYYLKTRIKSASNDMRVFVDEFVTKIAETYRSGRDALEAVALEHD